MLRPVDQEGGVVTDVDGAAFTKAEKRVLQTGGDATVSTT
jgi:hypothetical protein